MMMLLLRWMVRSCFFVCERNENLMQTVDTIAICDPLPRIVEQWDRVFLGVAVFL
jgi:hypothetical protein